MTVHRTQMMQSAQYRLAEHYLEKLHMAQRAYQQGNERAAQALTIFDQEREQVQQWQAWASTRAEHDEKAAALCSAYAEASPDIYKLRLPTGEYLAWLEAGLSAARHCGDQRLELMHLLDLSETYRRIMEYEKAFAYADQALSIARLINDIPLLALSLNMYGNAVREKMQFDAAQMCYEESLHLYEKLGDRRGIAEILNNLGVLALHMRKYDAAQDYLEQCLKLNQELGNQEGLATCLNNLGFLANRHEAYPTACVYLEQASALFRVLGDAGGISMSLTNLGLAWYYQEEYMLACNYLEQSLTAARTSGFLELEVTCLSRSGDVAMARGDLVSAREYFEQSLASDREQESSALSPVNLGNLAIIYQQLQQEDRVYPALRRALEAACHQSAERYKLIVLCKAAQVWVLRGQAMQAATWLGLVENHSSLAVKTPEIKRSIRTACAECEAALSPEQFATAWEVGKNLDLDTVVAELLSELGKD
jgi:tetratricopeptide (TPR) repeat protein